MLPKDIKSSKVTKKWLAIIKSYVEAERSTYISATSWCKQNNINYYMFIRWHGRFRNEGMLNPDDLESSAEVRSQMDNLQPLLLNNSNGGGDWWEHSVSYSQVRGRQDGTKNASQELYAVTKEILDKHLASGDLKNE